MMITWATWLTISRILVTPFIIHSLVYEHWMQAGVLFALAALSDTLDGALARHTGQTTSLGIYLDPLADKILIVSCYLTLLCLHGSSIGIPGWLVVMVVIREFFFIVGGLMLYRRSLANRTPIVFAISPSLVGKWTTVIHCVLLGSVYAVKAGLFTIGSWYFYSLAILAAVFMMVSALQYTIAWVQLMRMINLLSLCMFCLLGGYTSSFQANDDFTVKRPTSGLQSRQQLRDCFAEALSDYLELLVEELSLVARRLSIDIPCGEREQQKWREYIKTLYEAQQFLRNGSREVVQLPYNVCNVQEDVSHVYGLLVDAIAGTQREAMRVLHKLLERDAQCCFVACKAKTQLEKYIQQVGTMKKLASHYHDYLYTIVQNFEKSSE